MSILDEIKKMKEQLKDNLKNDRDAYGKPHQIMGKIDKTFSDIEKILGEMKCENCKSYRGYSFSPSECMNLKSAVEYIATPSVNFFCNQFEAKE